MVIAGPDLHSGGMRIVLCGENVAALSAAACLRNHRITVVSFADEHRLTSLSRFVQDSICVPEQAVSQVLRFLERLRERTGEKLLLFPCSDTWIEILAA